MSFDPNLPQENTLIDAAQMRSQLHGLKALIDAILTLTAAQVDGVSTLDPGNPASVSVSVIGNTLHFTFAIPRGNDGSQGLPGNNGNDGAQGPPFAQALIDAVNTLNPGEPATVSVTFDGSNVRFTFGIPRGNDGNDGGPGSQGPPFANALVDGVNTLDPGQPASVTVSFDGTNVHFTFGIPRGADGANGSDGAPGEVSNQQLNDAVANAIVSTSANTNAVATLDTPMADPDSETLRQAFNTLVLAARR